MYYKVIDRDGNTLHESETFMSNDFIQKPLISWSDKLNIVYQTAFLLADITFFDFQNNTLQMQDQYNVFNYAVNCNYNLMNPVSSFNTYQDIVFAMTMSKKRIVMKNGSAFITLMTIKYNEQQENNESDNIIFLESLPGYKRLNSAHFVSSNKVYYSWIKGSEIELIVYNPLSYGANEDHCVPQKSISLTQNYPNPFNPSTKISYTLVVAGATELSVYNINGQKVCTLVNEKQSAGTHEVIWNGQDEHGNRASSGLYFYRLRAGGECITKKMILMK